VVITFTKLRDLSTSEKSCGFNSSYEVHIKYPDNFTVAFLNWLHHIIIMLSMCS